MGSETAAAWAVPLLAFAHGNFSVHNQPHWKLTRDKKFYGGWWPPERPPIFFQKIHAPPEYRKARYNPAYRLPLFQAVFHESVLTTDRWEIPHNKFSNLTGTRELLELLYGVPSIWALDKKEIKAQSARLKKLSAFFSKLHKDIALEPLSDFKWLTSDRMVQQITFGNKVRLIANFTHKPYKGIPSQSLQAYWTESKKSAAYKP